MDLTTRVGIGRGRGSHMGTSDDGAHRVPAVMVRPGSRAVTARTCERVTSRLRARARRLVRPIHRPSRTRAHPALRETARAS